MKVLFKLGNRIETIFNVGVDDKCFPLVGGVHPYSESSSFTSPLTQKSAIWFKTLALDAVYIDCDRRNIYWATIENDINPKEVVLRRKSSHISADPDFIPPTAKPLLEDVSLYDLDSSYKEMISKCCECARKFNQKILSPPHFNNIVANLLHVYILPSVTFSFEDMYSLSRTRCLIEERLEKAGGSINLKTEVIGTHQRCMQTMIKNYLTRNNFESERHLRGYKKPFLTVFLRKTEDNIINLNFSLEAAQSKVNWARKENDTAEHIKSFRSERDKLNEEVNGLIRVREAIKNVISRKDLTKKKKGSSPTVKDIELQDIFIELNRRIEVEEGNLNKLCSDKVNICAAREAVIATVNELDNNNRESRSSRFSPDDFVDYQPGHTSEDSQNWMTFDERVNTVLENRNSNQFKIHQQGCDRLASQVDMVLSEFKLTVAGVEEVDADIPESPVQLRQKPTAFHRRAAVSKRETFTLIPSALAIQEIEASMGDFPTSVTSNESNNQSSDSTSLRHISLEVNQDRDFYFSRDSTHEEIEGQEYYKIRSTTLEALHFIEDHYTESGSDEVNKATEEQSHLAITVEPSSMIQSCETRRKSLHISRRAEALAFKCLMASIERIKDMIQGHFSDVVDSFYGDFSQPNMDKAAQIELKEMLWKAYEKSFCGELLSTLLELYSTALIPCCVEAFRAMSTATLYSLLEGDKILDQIFGFTTISASPSDGISEDRISMSTRASNLSNDIRYCSIGDLYNLANADSSKIYRKFGLDSDTDQATGSPSSSESGASITSTDLFPSMEEICDSGNSTASEPNSGDQQCVLSENASGAGIEKPFQGIGKVSDVKAMTLEKAKGVLAVLDPLLNPFRKQVRKCLGAKSFLDKIRYISRAVEELNSSMSQLYGSGHQSACDDIITMLVIALSNMPEDTFVGLYINMRLLTDILPNFLGGTLWDYNLVSMFASYDFLLNNQVCSRVFRRFPGSFKVKSMV